MNYEDDDSYGMSEYELGMEGEYRKDPPPGYESWAEWHYENGDELPTDEDYGIFDDDDDEEYDDEDEEEYDDEDEEYDEEDEEDEE